MVEARGKGQRHGLGQPRETNIFPLSQGFIKLKPWICNDLENWRGNVKTEHCS